MVVLTDDIENLPPAERVRRLRELKEKKEEEKKRLLDEKQKELDETSSKLEESIRELVSEEPPEAGDAHPFSDQESLEESVDEVPANAPVANVTYALPLEDLMPGNLYDLSDYNLYNELSRIREKGYMTPEEQRRVSELSNQASSITEAYSTEQRRNLDEQRGFYLSRTESVLKDLSKKMHDLSDGLYTTRRSE